MIETAVLEAPPKPKVGRVWPKPSQWSYEDYLHLPDDGKRYEIIEGVLYVTNAPNFDHQFTVSKLDRILGLHVEEKKLGLVLVAPFEVHLPGIAKPVQPDVFFIAAERQVQRGAKFFDGAPDLVIEVTSPSTARVDRSIKLSAYERAGVQEYWIADPRTRFIEVYTLPTGSQEYIQAGQFGPGDILQTDLLPDLGLDVMTLFLSDDPF